MKPERIISGGQTGADQGALCGAQQIGIATGGWMPFGFLTEDGPQPLLAATYGMWEHPLSKYPPRTRLNVRDSNGTVWCGPSTDSLGYRATHRATKDYNKPFLDNPTSYELRLWVELFKIKTLNVAGPRGSRDLLAHQRARELIVEAFR